MIAQTFKGTVEDGLRVIRLEVEKSDWLREHKPERVNYHELAPGIRATGEYYSTEYE
jgi:hypothetical protein